VEIFMPKLFKWVAVVFGGLILLLVIIGLGGSDSYEVPSVSKQVAQEEEIIYGVGETMVYPRIELIIVSVNHKKSVGGEFLNEVASEGAILITVDYKYKNTSPEPIRSFSKPRIKLIDNKGVEYNPDIGKSSVYAVEKNIDSKVISDLNPGITVNDVEVFEIGEKQFVEDKWTLLVSSDNETYRVAIE
jgi:hypothetical protein